MTPLRTLITNDLRLFFSDRRAMLSVLLVPITMASFFALIFGGMGKNEKKAPIAIVVADSDKSTLSQEIVARLRADTNLGVTEADPIAARAAVQSGAASVAIVLPTGFGNAAGSALFTPSVTPPEVTLYTDPSKNAEVQLTRGVLLQHLMQTTTKSAFGSPSAVTNVEEQLAALKASGKTSGALPEMLQSVRTYLRESGGAPTADGPGMGMREPCTIREEAARAGSRDNDDRRVLRVHSFVGMGVQGLFFYAMDAALGLLRERRTGIWKRLRAAPLARTSLLLGRLLSIFLIGLTVQLAIFGFGMVVFGLRIEGSVPGFLVLLLANSLSTAGFGLLIAALGKTEAQCRALSVPAILGMSVLGGAWFPSFLMPAWVRQVSLLIPTRWAIDGFDAMTWRGLGFASAGLPAVALLGFAVAFTTFAFVRFRWEE